jgi:hypothetical protein
MGLKSYASLGQGSELVVHNRQCDDSLSAASDILRVLLLTLQRHS